MIGQMIGAVVNAGLVAMNIALFYTAGGHWWSIAAALFAAAGCGWCLAFFIASREH